MSRLRRREQALLVRLADGAFAGEEAEARLRAIPDGNRLLERQRRVARALAAGAERRPLEPTAAPSWQRAPQLAVAGALVAVLLLLLLLSPRERYDGRACRSHLPAAGDPAGARGGRRPPARRGRRRPVPELGTRVRLA